MKKGHIITTLLVLAVIGGTYAIYKFYVQVRLTRLKEHQTEEKQLETKIKQLQETFYGTKPAVVLTTWRGETEPWVQAVNRRSKFFNLGEIPLHVDVPEEKIGKFFYRDEFPKRKERLLSEALEKNCLLGNAQFGVPTVEAIQGTDPKRDQVSEWLTQYDYAAALTRIFINAGATQIADISVWPAYKSSSENLEIRTTGVTFTMPSMKDLVQFLEDLRSEPRYFTVDAIHISNSTLRNTSPSLEVEMIFTQARFLKEGEEREGGVTAAGPGGAKGPQSLAQGLSRMGNMFAGRSARSSSQARAGWWKRFRNWAGF